MMLTRRDAITLALATSAAAVLPASAQETTNLRVHTASPGSSAFAFTTTLQTVVQRELPVRMNVTAGMASTRSALDVVRGNVDLYISSPAVSYFMRTGSSMFKDIANAKELASDLRGMVNFPLGPYHIITFAESGIATLEDIKGKRVFAGPPGGAATTVGLAIIESVTGYKPDVDYELAKLDWSSGNQAFQDRQIDLAIMPTELPSAAIRQFALLDKIRLISIPEEAFKVDPLKSMISLPGRTISRIPPDIYGDNQVNEEDVLAVGSYIGIGVRKDLEADIVYEMTKAMFENINDFYNAADWMKAITLQTAFENMNDPLHAGALRYYREAGVDIPEALVPPEAK
ncbi:TAXI family TRAP transporter solute-binding subunit [Rhizobium sp. L1K21]|uniref:TAXI family TRAP transporter solute-binding subunit n=1 Tax=Rhizobium sp. L1K21 TaxID=2954933 RepID=UPI0020927ADF|nr:TAXI family TRAP transporter solute-binding subunit [Rhizobium sp. L1K21]MCO6188491.1 TAXI family TRAP transporter solute-binding subunit [Rhizobium sp. L1K21]